MSTINTANRYAMTIADAASIIEAGLTHNYSTLLQSMPGLGKTVVTKAVAAKLGMDIHIEHAATAEPSDYRGLAFPSADKKSATFLPYGLLDRMVNAKEPFVVFFDDIHNGMQAVQGPIAQIIEERRINNIRISKEVRFIAACNRKQDNAGANTLTTMLLSRFKTILEIKPDAAAWCNWAVTANMPAMLIAFIRTRPHMISTFNPSDRNVVNFACPRTLEALGNWINAGVYNPAVWAGCVGDQFTIEFKAFSDLFNTIGNLPANITKGIAPTPDQQTALANPDIQFMVASALAMLAKPVNIPNINQFISTLAPEMQFYFWTDAAARDNKIKQSAAFIQFAATHQNVI